jgi:hemerythrin superfamily protein
MRSVQRQIFHELEVHTAIEEEVFYPEAEAVGGEAEELVKEGEQEHHVVDVLMEEISALDANDEAFVPKMTVLIENVEHHAEEEETELFPKLRETFGDDRLRAMGTKLQEAKQRHASGDAGERTRDELYDAARQQDIPGRSKMSKDELAQAVDSD